MLTFLSRLPFCASIVQISHFDAESCDAPACEHQPIINRNILDGPAPPPSSPFPAHPQDSSPDG